jgi:hypothetical protein
MYLFHANFGAAWSARQPMKTLTPDIPSLDIETLFDKTSIMCFSIPEGLATDNKNRGG